MSLESGRRHGSVGALSSYGFTALRRRDLPVVARWLHQPQVRAWWGDPFRALALIRSDVAKLGVEGFLIRHRGRPIGFLQCYGPASDPLHGLPLDCRATRGIGFFIGDPWFLGTGCGAGILRAFSDRLLVRPEVCRVIAYPDPDNFALRHAFDKAGFRDADEAILPWGPGRLLVRGRWSLGDQLRVTVARVLASLAPQQVAILRERSGVGSGRQGSLGHPQSPAEIQRRSREIRKRLREIEARALAKLVGPDGKKPGPA